MLKIVNSKYGIRLLNVKKLSVSVTVTDLSKSQTPVTPASPPVPDKNAPLPASYEDVSRAAFRIKDGIRRTYCDKSDFLSDLCETTIYLKKDFMQYTGSFKERLVFHNFTL